MRKLVRKNVARKKLGRRISDRDRMIAQRLHAIRNERHMSREDVAAKLGVSMQQVEKYESGRNRLSAGRLAEIAELLNVDITYFYKGLTRGLLQKDEGTALLRTPGAIDLLRCYCAIRLRAQRSALVSLARALT